MTSPGGEPIVFVGICDLAGHVRGKAFPEADLARRLVRGVGFTHSNIMMSAFGPIHATPFGTEGDLMLVPDLATRVCVPFEDHAPEHFYLGDLRTTDGAFWECCPRQFLRRELEASPDFEDLMLLRECDDAGRVPGAVVGTADEALNYLRELERENGG